MMHCMELVGLMQKAFLWKSLVHKKALYWTAHPRFFEVLQFFFFFWQKHIACSTLFPNGSPISFICDWLHANRRILEEVTQIPIWLMPKDWLLEWDWANQALKMSPQNLVLLLMVMQIVTWSLGKGNIHVCGIILVYLAITSIFNVSCIIRFFVTPSDSVAIIAANAVDAIPYFSAGLKGVARFSSLSVCADVAKCIKSFVF